MYEFRKVLLAIFIGLPIVILVNLIEFIHFKITGKLVTWIRRLESWFIYKMNKKH